jgi:hypothetical protein
MPISSIATVSNSRLMPRLYTEGPPTGRARLDSV